jgi:hypothetical protein
MKNFITIILIFLVSLVVSLLCLKAIPGNINSNSENFKVPFPKNSPAYELSHERSSYATLVSLDESGKFDLSPALADVAAPDAGFYRDKYYSFFPPGLAVAAWPLYLVGKHFDYSLAAAYSMVAVFAAFGLIFLFLICYEIFKFPRWLSLFIIFSTGLASTYLNFSITFYQHVPSTFFLLVGFYSAWRYSRYHNWAWAAICWSCYGLASFFDYPNLIVFLPILGYLIMNGLYVQENIDKIKLRIRNSLIISSVFLMLLGGAHIYYNLKNFGNWHRFSNALPKYDPRNEAISNELNTSDIEKLADDKDKISFALRETNVVNGANVLLFEIDKSLLLHMPIFLLALFGIYKMRKKFTREILTIIAIIIVNIFLYASFHDPWGGWGFGPRYLVTSMPFMNILVGFWLVDSKWWKKLLVWPFVMYSSGAALLGAVTKNFLVPNVEKLPGQIYPSKVWSEFQFLKVNENGTFIFNEFLSHKYSLTEYFIVLWVFVNIIFIIILFILPYLKYGNKHQENLDR